jgi:hypothetical protein
MKSFGQKRDSNLIRLIFEKTYLHTDRDLYAPGEDIWFKAYLVDGQTNKLAGSSNNLYVELISPAARLVERKIIRIDSGTGHGDFRLQDSLQPGSYRLRAYTSWMRNFGDNFFFEKTVGLTGAYAAESGSSKNNPLKSEEAGQPQTVTDSISLRFFPEGGSRVAGVASVIAFRAADESGNGVGASGTIKSAAGVQVTDFSCDSTGLGSILLPPTADGELVATGMFTGGKPFSVILPDASKTGVSISVGQSDSLFRIVVSTNQVTLNSLQGKSLLLRGTAKGIRVLSAEFSLNQPQQVINIPKKSLPAGIIVFTLFDPEGRPQCERLAYFRARKNERLQISADKQVFARGGTATLKLHLADSQGNPVKASLSASVADPVLQQTGGSSIVSYLDFESELRGKIPGLARYFDESNPGRAAEIDLLLLTHGWRDFLWKRVADSLNRLTFPAEKGISVSGKVSKGQEPVKGAEITMQAPASRGNRLFLAQTDSSGRFFIESASLYGRQRVTLNTKTGKLKSPGALTIDSALSVAPIPEIPGRRAGKPFPDTLPGPNAGAYAYARRKFSLNDTIRLNEVSLKGARQVKIDGNVYFEFGYKDETYTINSRDKGYTSLLHYLLANSTLRDTGDGYVGIRVKGGFSRPFLIVNNKFIKYENPARYLNIDVQQFTRINLRHLIGIYGDVYLLYLTVNPDAINPPAENTAALYVNGYDSPREFYSDDASNIHVPDLRSTLYWAPDIQLNEHGEAMLSFLNSNQKGRFRAIVEGVTESGVPVSASFTYEVK